MRNPSLRLHPIPASITAICPIAGRIDRYARADPLNSEIECPDMGLVDAADVLRENPSSATGSSTTDWSLPVPSNAVRIYSYDMVIHAGYLQKLLPGAVDEPSMAGTPPVLATPRALPPVFPAPSAALGELEDKPILPAPSSFPARRGPARGGSDDRRHGGDKRSRDDGWTAAPASHHRSQSRGGGYDHQRTEPPQRRREGRDRSPRRDEERSGRVGSSSSQRSGSGNRSPRRRPGQ
jgi:hypothetical protein